jgi:hypothetical protein
VIIRSGVRDIVAFFKSLTGEVPGNFTTAPVLPSGAVVPAKVAGDGAGYAAAYIHRDLGSHSDAGAHGIGDQCQNRGIPQ